MLFIRSPEKYLFSNVPFLRASSSTFFIFCSMVIYPVIPKGMIIFRIVCTAAHTMEDVEYTLNAFKEIKAKLDAGLYDGDDIAAMTVK